MAHRHRRLSWREKRRRGQAWNEPWQAAARPEAFGLRPASYGEPPTVSNEGRHILGSDSAFVCDRLWLPPWSFAPHQPRSANEKPGTPAACVSPAPRICAWGVFPFYLVTSNAIGFEVSVLSFKTCLACLILRFPDKVPNIVKFRAYFLTL